MSLLLVASCAAPAPEIDLAAEISRGRYMVLTGHCNNCHTAAYAARQGAIPETDWLMGNPVGWLGQQGTVYAPNLRLYMAALSEDEWIQAARTARPRAPMPWWSIRETTEADLRAMYKYVRSLQPVGEAAPAFLAPGVVPKPPYNQLPDRSLGPAAAPQ
jgi:mono/diheme cytochrome c family protein